MEKPFVTANAFDVSDMPVCDADQKVRMEAAYQEAKTYSKSDESVAEQGTRGCTCELIIRLLTGTATRTDQIVLAGEVAGDMYRMKHSISNLATLMDMLKGAGVEGIESDPWGEQRPPYPGGKKTWVN